MVKPELRGKGARGSPSSQISVNSVPAGSKAARILCELLIDQTSAISSPNRAKQLATLAGAEKTLSLEIMDHVIHY